MIMVGFMISTAFWIGSVICWIATVFDGIATLLGALFVLIAQTLVDVVRRLMWRVALHAKGPVAAMLALIGVILAVVKLLAPK